MKTNGDPIKQFLSLHEKAKLEVRFCWTPGCESTDIVKCHVVSERAQLNVYGGECYFLQSRFGGLLSEHMEFRRVSTRSALTFRGYCKNCDESLFRRLDSEFELNFETARLQAIRALTMKKYVHRTNYFAFREGEKLGITPPRKHIPSFRRSHRSTEDEETFYDQGLDEAKAALLSKEVYSVRVSLSHDPGFRMSVATTAQLDFLGNLVIRQSPLKLPQIYVSVLHDERGAFVLLTSSLHHKSCVDNMAEQISAINESVLESLIVSYFLFNPAGLTLSKQYVHALSPLTRKSIVKTVLAQKYGEYIGDMTLKKKLTPLLLNKLRWTAKTLKVNSIETLL